MKNKIEKMTFQKGEIIFYQGQNGNRCYLIERGEVDIFKVSDGKTVSLNKLGKGELFGEMAIIDSEPRMATATACTEVTVVVINSSVLTEKIAKCEPFIAGLIRNLTDKARSNAVIKY